jgi:hypothetical protein
MVYRRAPPAVCWLPTSGMALETSKMTVMFVLITACVLWAAVSVIAFGVQPKNVIEAGLLNFGRGYLIAILIFLVLAVYGMSSV